MIVVWKVWSYLCFCLCLMALKTWIFRCILKYQWQVLSCGEVTLKRMLRKYLQVLLSFVSIWIEYIFEWLKFRFSQKFLFMFWYTFVEVQMTYLLSVLLEVFSLNIKHFFKIIRYHYKGPYNFSNEGKSSTIFRKNKKLIHL